MMVDSARMRLEVSRTLRLPLVAGLMMLLTRLLLAEASGKLVRYAVPIIFDDYNYCLEGHKTFTHTMTPTLLESSQT
jgi:hypothetical protein